MHAMMAYTRVSLTRCLDILLFPFFFFEMRLYTHFSLLFIETDP